MALAAAVPVVVAEVEAVGGGSTQQTMPEILALGAIRAAPLILGSVLRHVTAQGVTSGRIVEVEAYQQDDPASHSYRGPTTRTSALFGPAGTVYVYFIYGKHYCMNIVTGRAGEGDALLVRALEPLEGIALMQQRRGTNKQHNLCSGPAKVVQAMGITIAQNGSNLFSGPLQLLPGEAVPSGRMMTGPRVGIRQNTSQPWRFWVADSDYVSPALTKA